MKCEYVLFFVVCSSMVVMCVLLSYLIIVCVGGVFVCGSSVNCLNIDV